LYPACSQLRSLLFSLTNVGNGDRELEEARVKKELAKIRKKVYQQKKSLDGYNRRKYIAKALFCFLMGYEIDFIYDETVGLLVSNKLAEKLVVR
jgi:AP-2 complex subunit alpha